MILPFTGTVPRAAVRGVVDTAPLLERDFARLAGLGWIGKNTLLIHRHLGSWLVIFVYPVEDVIRIRTGERGHEALMYPDDIDARRAKK